jgi:hypothetical protein
MDDDRIKQDGKVFSRRERLAFALATPLSRWRRNAWKRRYCLAL